MNLLRIENLSKTYYGEEGDIHALQGVNLSLDAGSLKVLLGRSGSGKSTLLRLCAGHDKPTGGNIYFEGKPVNGSSHERFQVFQEYDQLFPWMRVSANIEFSLRSVFRSMDRQQARQRAQHWLAETGMEGCGRLWPYELSGGMHQRATLARAFAICPKLLLLDEPFSALDALLRRTMQQLLISLCQRHGVSVLFVTHDIDEALFLDASPAILKPDGSAIVLTEGCGDVRAAIIDALGQQSGEDANGSGLHENGISGGLI